mgnify:CR=1 FL=1
MLAFYGLGLDRVLEVARSVTGNQNAYDKRSSTIASCVGCC